MNADDIKYIVLHKNDLSSKQLRFANDLLTETLKTEPDIYAEDGLIVYHVPDETVRSFMLLGDGWNRRENWDCTTTRWISNNATVLIYSGVTEDAVLKLKASDFTL